MFRFSGVLGRTLLTDFQSSACGIRDATVHVLVKASVPAVPPLCNKQIDVPYFTTVDEDFVAAARRSVQVLSADAASDEQLTAKILTGTLAGS